MAHRWLLRLSAGWLVLLSAAAHLGCGSLPLRNDHFSCDPGDPGSCPNGWYCRLSPTSNTFRCFENEPTDAGGPDAEITDANTIDARPPCGPGTCDGCCDQGVCQPGDENSLCGAGGDNCLDCIPSGESCDASGACVP